jgi:hypothetical protein
MPVSTIEPNELFRLAMALGLAPLVYALAKGLRFPGARWPLGIMYGAFAVGYAMTVLEDIMARATFNLLQHGCSAVGAIAFALAARAVYVEVAKQKAGSS